MGRFHVLAAILKSFWWGECEKARVVATEEAHATCNLAMATLEGDSHLVPDSAQEGLSQEEFHEE